MSAKILVEWVSIAELFLCAGVLLLMWRRRLFRDFPILAAFVSIRFTYAAVTIPILFFRKYIGLERHTAYNIYAYSYWPSCILQAVLMVLLVYGIYSMALEPFEPLKKLGTIIFRWIAAISVAVSIGVAISPHMFGASQVANFIGQMQQTASVLTLCLLLFVCFALKPLGLTFGSRAFGASIGLGILATTQLLQSSWLPTPTALSVYSIIYFYSGLGACSALLVWGTYFALPEPERRMVLLPTTSPYFFWNKISEALGDEPGFVAISGFTPDSMAPGELEAMIMASQPNGEEYSPRVMQPVAVSRVG
jgi:hypothetical protein